KADCGSDSTLRPEDQGPSKLHRGQLRAAHADCFSIIETSVPNGFAWTDTTSVGTAPRTAPAQNLDRRVVRQAQHAIRLSAGRAVLHFPNRVRSAPSRGVESACAGGARQTASAGGVSSG